jgi:hypothetical protein
MADALLNCYEHRLGRIIRDISRKIEATRCSKTASARCSISRSYLPARFSGMAQKPISIGGVALADIVEEVGGPAVRGATRA